MQKNRKTLVKSFSMDILTVSKMERVIKSHFSNKLGASDFVTHAVNDLCNRIEFEERCECKIPESRWG